MSGPFALLGLTGDTDAATVKRAYAALLRQFRPDEDPVGFQRLNDAYKACLQVLALPPHWLEQDAPASAGAPSGAMPQDPQSHADGAEETESERGDADLLAQVHARAMAGSARDLEGWLQQQEGWYSLVRRRELAPALVEQLMEEPPLPPAQLEIVLAFFHLDALPAGQFWLHDQVDFLRMHAADALHEQQARQEQQGIRDVEDQLSDGDNTVIVAIIAIVVKAVIFASFFGALRNCS